MNYIYLEQKKNPPAAKKENPNKIIFTVKNMLLILILRDGLSDLSAFCGKWFIFLPCHFRLTKAEVECLFVYEHIGYMHNLPAERDAGPLT